MNPRVDTGLVDPGAGGPSTVPPLHEREHEARRGSLCAGTCRGRVHWKLRQDTSRTSTTADYARAEQTPRDTRRRGADAKEESLLPRVHYLKNARSG